MTKYRVTKAFGDFMPGDIVTENSFNNHAYFNKKLVHDMALERITEDKPIATPEDAPTVVENKAVETVENVGPVVENKYDKAEKKENKGVKRNVDNQ